MGSVSHIRLLRSSSLSTTTKAIPSSGTLIVAIEMFWIGFLGTTTQHTHRADCWKNFYKIWSRGQSKLDLFELLYNCVLELSTSWRAIIYEHFKDNLARHIQRQPSFTINIKITVAQNFNINDFVYLGQNNVHFIKPEPVVAFAAYELAIF